MLLLFSVFPFSCDADDIQFLIVVPLVHRITTPSTVQVSANWKFRRFSVFPVQWENRSEAVTSWILPSFRCLLFSTFDVWAISNTRLAALLDGSCVRIKRRNRFLGSPRRGSGEPGAQRRSVSQCEPAPGATVASGARYFYFRLCPLAMAALEQAAVQMVENARGRLNRLHRAAEPPNWSQPSQHQSSWPVKISETGGGGGVVVWEVEGGERWERLLLSASDLLLAPLQLWPSSPGGGKQSDVTLIITAANHSNHSKCETARIGLWFHLCQILHSSFCTKGGEVKSNDSGHSHKKSLNPTSLSDNFSEQSIVSWRLKIMPSPVKTWNWSFQYFLSWSQCKWSHMWWGSNTTQFPSPVPLNVTTRDRFCHLSWHFRRWLSVTWF